MNYKVLKYLSQGIGHCVLCGDMQGPWAWYHGIGWICDDCVERGDVHEVQQKKREAGQIPEETGQNYSEK